MFIYWIMLMLPVAGVVMGAWQKVTHHVYRSGLMVIAAVCVAAIGLRHEVGGDWGAYLNYYHSVDGQRLEDVLMLSDPAYIIINWISSKIGGGIYLVNAFIGLLVVSGVFRLALRQPYPTMAFMAAVPYLLVVVSMGYSRQAAAIGLIFHGIVFFIQRKITFSVVSFLAAVLFHKTAILVVILIFGIFLARREWFGLGCMIFFAALLFMFGDLFWGRVEGMYDSYVVEQMESTGAVQRYALMLLPASLLIIFSSRLQIVGTERKLWQVLWLGLVSALPFLSDYSTLIDRILLYWYPVVIVFWGRFVLVTSNAWGRVLIRLGSSAVHVIILWYWLFYAVHAKYWVPYQMYPFV